MPVIVFRIVWPFIRTLVIRRAAERAAEYLQERRERRLKLSGEVDGSVVQAQALACPPDSSSFSTANAVWYTLSGVMLGSALGVIVTQIFQPED